MQRNPKEQIIQHIGKYIKRKQSPDGSKPSEEEEANEEILQNLREFLGYLEEKNIISSKQLQSKEEMDNLIKDLMKLDLAKFSKNRQGSNYRRGSASPNIG